MLRIAIVAVPLAAGYGTSVSASHLLTGQIRHNRWWLLVVVVASLAVCVAVERGTRRFLPLAALLKLSMLFPERAPNRLRVARGATSTRMLNDRVAQARTRDAAHVAESVLALVTAMTAHDRRTRGHCERVRVFVDLLGEELRLPREDRDRLRWAALLHDVGKLRVAPAILNKPTRLSNAEWHLVAEHPTLGEQLLGPLVGWLGEWGAAVRQHHERFDGTGYPDQLAGHDICRAARIVSIADSYEVMTAHRAYKKPMATVAARAELARCAGTQFDPTYVRAFLSISLPRLLWAMGPGALLMNIPMLRLLAQTTPKAVAAAPQGAAAAAVVVGGQAATVTPTAVGQPGRPVAAADRPALGQFADPAASSTTQTPADTSTPSGSAPSTGPTTGPSLGGGPSTAASPTGGGGGPISPPGSTITGPAGTGPSMPGPSSSPPSGTGPTNPPSTGTTTSPVAPLVDVSLTSVPSSTITVPHATVGFSADPGAVAAFCSVDGGSARECTGGTVTFTNLADGVHTISVWATNVDGAAGPAQHTSFTVDTTAPAVMWTSTPPAVLATSSMTATFQLNDSTATAWCALDGGAATVCSDAIGYTGLADGPHTISAFAIDPAGNRGPAVSASVTIAAGAPTLLSKPASIILIGNSGTFTWTAVSGLSYQYSLDGGPWTTTSSPNRQTVSLPALGGHTFRLRGSDSIGNHTAITAYTITVIL